MGSPKDIIFANARVFDGVTDQLSDPRWVRIANGRIAETSSGVLRSDAADTIDVGGRTLMPGLIDAHFHAYAADVNIGRLDTQPTSYLSQHARVLLEAALRRGFTTVRDAGGADYGLWKATEEGLIDGPRIFYSGRALSQTGGHGDSRAQNIEPCSCRYIGRLSEVADGVDAVRASARETLRRGAHQVKIFVSGGVASPTDPIWMVQFCEDEVRAIVEEATSRRTYVLAHAYTGESIERAVRWGVRSIEHGNLLTESAARAMAEHEAFLVPTLITYDAMSRFGVQEGYPAESLEKLTVVAEKGLDAIAMARAAGVQVGLGTDLLGRQHRHQLEEFRLRGEREKPIDVLRSATSVNAKLLNQTDNLGCIREGAHADMLVLDGDPLQDLGVLWREPNGIRLVMKGGRVVTNSL